MSPSRLRHRILAPARLLKKVTRIGKPSEISRARMKEFLREMDRRPRVSLPSEAPGSVALIVPCFGHAAFLADMFDSIVAQTRLPDEVLFIEDCSPDSTGDILRSLIAAHRDAAGGRLEMLVNDRNIGQAASLNRGIAAASSDLIMILNDDDYLMHDAIESMLGFFRQHPDVALIGAHSIHFAGHDWLAGAPKTSAAWAAPGLPLVVQRPKQLRGYRRYNDLNMTHSGSCFLKIAWEVVGGYRADKTQRVVPFSDRDFQLRVNALWPVAVSYETPFSFWRRDSSVDVHRNS